ncbi:MAG: RHS repeat domain-containing protein [Flammeovirgaceae bacterium]
MMWRIMLVLLVTIRVADQLNAQDNPYTLFGDQTDIDYSIREVEKEAEEQDYYRFGFNGKENDREWGTGGLTQDYGFRLYNPALGKFLSVDPLAPEYPELTTYQFASNRPIDGIDLDGLEFAPVNNRVFYGASVKIPLSSSNSTMRVPVGQNAGNMVKHSWLKELKFGMTVGIHDYYGSYGFNLTNNNRHRHVSITGYINPLLKYTNPLDNKSGESRDVGLGATYNFGNTNLSIGILQANYSIITALKEDDPKRQLDATKLDKLAMLTEGAYLKENLFGWEIKRIQLRFSKLSSTLKKSDENNDKIIGQIKAQSRMDHNRYTKEFITWDIQNQAFRKGLNVKFTKTPWNIYGEPIHKSPFENARNALYKRHDVSFDTNKPIWMKGLNLLYQHKDRFKKK